MRNGIVNGGIELRQLRYFVAVVEEGQISRAARRLHLAQPAVSQAIAQLERQLGVELLNRCARGVEPTQAGQAFIGRARDALRAADHAVAVAHASARARDGELAVGFMSFPLVRRLKQVFDTFARRYPRVQLRWREVTFPLEDGLAWLDNVDIALSSCAVENPGIRAARLSREPRVVVTGTRHPLAQRSGVRVDDILNETFPGVDSAVARAWAASWHLDRRRGRPARTTDDTTRTLPEAAAVVASGAAVCTMADLVAREYEGSSISVLPLVDADPAVLTLSWEEENLNPLIEAFVRLACEMTSEGTGSDPS